MKKQSIGLLILLLVWSSFSFASDWGQCALTAAPLIPNGNEMILEPSGGTDDPQPDTLFYDSGVGMYLLYGGTNLYCNERFTPPVEFELRSVYIMPLNAFNNTTDDMTIYVKANNGGVPGAILARIMIPHPIPGHING
jgi:hypothetical protein